MRVLDELGREIERIAAEAGDARPRRRWWRSGGLLVVLPLSLAAVAVAATSGILSGAPVRNPPGVHASPRSGYGVAVGSGKLLGVRAADPSGGPDWALRLVRTSRELGCVQLGRLVDGRLGVLGHEGAFGNDGRFHELGAHVLVRSDCQQVDGAGRLFIAITYVGLPDSADPSACMARARQSIRQPVCPPGSLRTVYFGLLGPEATAVTYAAADGRQVRQAVSGPDGAYLVVLPTHARRSNIGYFIPAVTPGSGLRSVEYRDGSVCRIPDPRRLGGARGCPLKGYAAVPRPTLTHADLAATVRVHLGTGPEHAGAGTRRRRGVPPVPAQRRVTVSFRAGHAANARSFYTVTIRIARGGPGCGSIMSGPIARDVAAGTVVTQPYHVPTARCASRSGTRNSGARASCRLTSAAWATRRSGGYSSGCREPAGWPACHWIAARDTVGVYSRGWAVARSRSCGRPAPSRCYRTPAPDRRSPTNSGRSPATSPTARARPGTPAPRRACASPPRSSACSPAPRSARRHARGR